MVLLERLFFALREAIISRITGFSDLYLGYIFIAIGI